MDTLVLLVMTKVSWIHFTVSNPLCHTQFDRTTIMDWLWPLYTGPMGGGHYTQVVTIIHRSQGWPLSTGCDHYTQVPQAWPLWTGCDHYTQVPTPKGDHYTQVHCNPTLSMMILNYIFILLLIIESSIMIQSGDSYLCKFYWSNHR